MIAIHPLPLESIISLEFRHLAAGKRYDALKQNLLFLAVKTADAK